MKQTIEIDVPDGYKAVYNKDTRKIEIVKIELPKTWEEFCKNNPINNAEYFIGSYSVIKEILEKGERDVETDKNMIQSKETAEAFLALMQLIQLRDCYRQGWKPDWRDYTTKRCIICLGGVVDLGWAIGEQHVLSFQSEEIRDEFLKNFSELIEEAKEFI